MTKHDKREISLDGWAITIIHDHAYLSGLDENNKNIDEKEVHNIIFIDAEAKCIKKSGEIITLPPGFQVFTDSGIYWCSCFSADNYTIADTAESLSRIMTNDIIECLTNPKIATDKMHEAEEDCRAKRGVVPKYDEFTFSDAYFD